MPPKSPPLTGNLHIPSPPAYQPPPQVYSGGGIPPPPSQTQVHRQHQQYPQANPGAPVYVPPPGPAAMTQPSPSSSPYSTTVRQHPQNVPVPQPRGGMVTGVMTYQSSPTTAELWSGARPPPQSQGQMQHASSKSNLRPGSGGPGTGSTANRPLGVIPPLSSVPTAGNQNLPSGGLVGSNPERPHSNTSLSSSDSGPGSTVSSSRSSSRDPLPAVSSASFPSSSATPPSAVFYNGQPPASKPPYGSYRFFIRHLLWEL